MTDAIEPVSTFCVQDPFTANDYADIILRSSDGFSFYAIKCLLLMTSPIFRDMISRPKATIPAGQSGERNLPVVDITESGIVTDALLRYLYPVDDPDLTVELAFDVLLATQKYEFQRELRLAKDAIRALCSMDESAVFRTFALASRHRLENEIRFAAQESLKYCLLKSPQIHILDPSSGRAILILSQYHNEVANRVADMFLRTQPEAPGTFGEFILCEECNKAENNLPTSLLKNDNMPDTICIPLTAEQSFHAADSFTDNEFGNVILRTSDGFDFYVVRAVLSISSPVFKDMFSIPQPSISLGQDLAPCLPVIVVEESGVTVNSLRRCIYPVSKSHTTVEVALGVLLAAQEYEMEIVINWEKESLESQWKDCCPSDFRVSKQTLSGARD
ncbi:hypothetical protein ACEPAG_4179 [Sanghuangporus baumii]